MRLPATPGWDPLALVVCGPFPLLAAGPGSGFPPLLAGGGPLVVVVGGPSPLLAEGPGWVFLRHSWLRAPGAVPRHSWLGSTGRGGGCFCGVGRGVSRVVLVLVARRVHVVSVLVCVLCVRGVCVGGGAGAGVPSVCVCVCVRVRVWCVGGLWLPVLASPGWGLLLVLVGLWLVCAVMVPRDSWRRLLSVIPPNSWLDFAPGGGGCSSPLLAEGPGAVPRHSWLGSAGGGGMWSLATPGCGSWLRLPATPGWGLPVAVGCFVRVGVSRVVCVCGVSGCACWSCCCVFCVFVVSVLLVVWCGGVVWVCLPHALVCVVACAWCAIGLWLLVPASFAWGLRPVFVWVWLACAVGPPPLLAEGPGCSAPPLLAGVCRCVVVVGPSPLLAGGFGCGAPPLLAGVRHRLWWVVPCHSWPRAAGVVSRHSWLGSAGCGGGGSLATPACGPRGALLLSPGVCVCVLCGALCWCGWCALVLRGVVAVCVCVCVRCVVCGVCHTWFGSRRRSTWSRPKSRKRGPLDV